MYIISIIKGFEVCRTGGSSGLTTNTTDDSLLYILCKFKYSTPRVIAIVMIVQKKNCYKIIYILLSKKRKKVLNAITHLQY